MARLVAIGDSLVQGAQSMAVHDVSGSFVSMVAQAMEVSEDRYVIPDFSGAGGLPFNFEWMARQLESSYGEDVSFWEWPKAVASIARMLQQVEQYWERGPGNEPGEDVLYHNLGVFGFRVADAYQVTARYCRNVIGVSQDDVMQPPSYGWLRIAQRVLNPARTVARDDDTLFDVARRIRDAGPTADAGIENLLVCLGANNCLNTAFQLCIQETQDDDMSIASRKTLWSAKAFERAYRLLADHIDELGAANVFVATVPHVMQMPVVKGIANGGNRSSADGYFDYYIRPWQSIADFTPLRDPHLTARQAKYVDHRVDVYNEIIADIADARHYHVVDLCRLFDEVAYYRNGGQVARVLPPALQGLDARSLKCDHAGAVQEGGLISLDGMHPTLCGYGLMAQLVVDAIRQTGQSIKDVDFQSVRDRDSLVSSPPRTLDDLEQILRLLEQRFNLSRWLRISIDNGIEFVP